MSRYLVILLVIPLLFIGLLAMGFAVSDAEDSENVNATHTNATEDAATTIYGPVATGFGLVLVLGLFVSVLRRGVG